MEQDERAAGPFNSVVDSDARTIDMGHVSLPALGGCDDGWRPTRLGDGTRRSRHAQEPSSNASAPSIVALVAL
jgi:hypothetical protein